ncbi:sericin 1-like isoform X2 [Aphidius gifuensis]|uniref:sericin 1-like isoform X2 n=1 Tax=Aphidius gifuensis TaxID=684658 RepID=UPI001CDC2B96|nr:sericin 1-like isoform X2 [Aphidius gifuensis]
MGYKTVRLSSNQDHSFVTIGGCILSILGGSSARSYSTSDGRGQDFTGTYSSGGFVGLKDINDLPDHNFGTSNTNRYATTLPGSSHSASGNAYSSSSYSDDQGSGVSSNTAGTSGTNTGSNSNSSPDIINNISSDTSSDISINFSPGASSSLDYNSPASSSHGSVNFANYAGSQQTSSDNNSPLDYGSSSASASYSPASPQLSSFTGSKTSAYTSGSSPTHGSSPYTSGSSLNYPAAHSNSYPSSSLLSSSSSSSSYPSSMSGSFSGSRYSSPSYQAAHTPSNNHPESLKFTSTAALNNYLSKIHANAPSYSHNSIPNHHGPNYLHSTSSNIAPSYSKSSSPYYPAGAYPKNPNKFIIIKDGHGGMMHSERPISSSSLYGGGGSNYKVRSAGPYSSGHNFAGNSNYGSSIGYNGNTGGGHHSAPSTFASLFGFS